MARRVDIDFLKGFAILAVVLYHLGVSQSGYLGVDVFFVINGFLIVPSVVRHIGDGDFSYFSFIEKRIMRLLPLILLVTALSLIVGYYGMLPDDYENLGESVIATNFFSNNILASITTRDYWFVGNYYNPLMHTWYIGILFEFYIILPLILMIVKALSKICGFGYNKYMIITLISLSILSFFFYLNPSIHSGDKFYLLHCRFYELSLGGLAGLWIVNHRGKRLYNNGHLCGFNFFLLLLAMFVGIFYLEEPQTGYNLIEGGAKKGESFIPQHILLLISVALTIFFVLSDNQRSRLIVLIEKMKIVTLLGVMSYSIFVWHQPILAFTRYYISDSLTLLYVILFLTVVFMVSYFSYRYIEKKLMSIKLGVALRLTLCLAFILINGIAFTIYTRAGVVRDVPELYIFKNDIYHEEYSAYIDRIYEYDKDFPSSVNGKYNVLVIGNSYARDWANVLLESEMSDSINLSYIYEYDSKYAERVKMADYVFIFDWKHEVPNNFWLDVSADTQVWGIGTKRFGDSMRAIYRNRHRSDYYNQTIQIDHSFITINEMMKNEWKDKYIDFLDKVLVGDDKVRVFYKDRFISPDTKHFSKAGAEYFAETINFSEIFTNR